MQRGHHARNRFDLLFADDWHIRHKFNGIPWIDEFSRCLQLYTVFRLAVRKIVYPGFKAHNQPSNSVISFLCINTYKQTTHVLPCTLGKFNKSLFRFLADRNTQRYLWQKYFTGGSATGRTFLKFACNIISLQNYPSDVISKHKKLIWMKMVTFSQN